MNQAANEDKSGIVTETKRVQVPFDQFLGEMNGSLPIQGMWDYKVYSGVEEADAEGRFGIVVDVIYAVVKDGAPPCPSSIVVGGGPYTTNPAYWAWQEQWLEHREAHFFYIPAGTPVPKQKSVVGAQQAVMDSIRDTPLGD
jgi:hypothetical protein